MYSHTRSSSVRTAFLDPSYGSGKNSGVGSMTCRSEKQVSSNSSTSHWSRSSTHALAAGSHGQVGRNQPNIVESPPNKHPSDGQSFPLVPPPVGLVQERPALPAGDRGPVVGGDPLHLGPVGGLLVARVAQDHAVFIEGVEVPVLSLVSRHHIQRPAGWRVVSHHSTDSSPRGSAGSPRSGTRCGRPWTARRPRPCRPSSCDRRRPFAISRPPGGGRREAFATDRR